jgi:alanine-glyoxylate transaminase/serine-glyoxylate transaminase/serine-pyruvate transaminase
MAARFARHRALGRACKAAIAGLGLNQVPLASEYAANTMTAPRYPAGVGAGDLLPRVKAAGAVLAGGLHPEIRAEYFRIGHMGPTNLGDLLATIGALEVGLAGCGYAFERGLGVAAALSAYQAGEE